MSMIQLLYIVAYTKIVFSKNIWSQFANNLFGVKLRIVSNIPWIDSVCGVITLVKFVKLFPYMNIPLQEM